MSGKGKAVFVCGLGVAFCLAMLVANVACGYDGLERQGRKLDREMAKIQVARLLAGKGELTQAQVRDEMQKAGLSTSGRHYVSNLLHDMVKEGRLTQRVDGATFWSRGTTLYGREG
jgi:hypothetical protein